MIRLDDVVAFVNEFVEDEHRALKARCTERDFLKFLMAVKPVQARFLKGLDANVDRSMNPGQKFWDDAPQKLASTVARPIYAGNTDASFDYGVFQRLWIDEREGALRIISREVKCTTCSGEGSPCADCSATGWQYRAGGEHISGVAKADEIRRLQPPSASTDLQLIEQP